MKRVLWVFGIAGLASLFLADRVLGLAGGGGLQLLGLVVGGGGLSGGGAYVLRGAVPSSASGRSLSLVDPGTGEAPLVLIGGLIGSGPSTPPLRPAVRVRFTADKLAELSWDVDIGGYVLEFSPTVGELADWKPVDPQPVGNTFTTPCAQPARYFRLRSL
ncbi:MAG: hypothetical protein AB7O66_18295 [Limisphaerales bacterium]